MHPGIEYHVGMSSLTSQASSAARWLESNAALPVAARESLARLSPVLLEQVPRGQAASLVIAGPPGSGKSTLARLLSFLLNEYGRPAVSLSLDDYYLSQRDREALARKQHPLLRQRGVPGTHDWLRLLHDIDSLRAGRTSGLKLPVFDKSTDDVAPEEQWRSIGFTPSCLIVEGWCIGAPAQDLTSLADPVNEMERFQDTSGAWRMYANTQLARYHSDLLKRTDHYWYIDVPGWNQVVDWRWRQEQELAQPRLRSREEVAGFLATFERIAGHMQETSAHWAGFRLQADTQHRLQVIG